MFSASLSAVPPVETALLTTAMHSFVIKESSDAFDIEGTLGSRQDEPAGTTPAVVEYTSYTVKAGENISSIAKKFG